MKKTLMIDMDDVIVSGGFLYLINEFQGTSYTEEDFDDFYMQEKIENKKEFFNFFITKNLYDNCNINNKAYEVMEKLNKKYKLYIGTSYVFREIPRESGIFLTQKYDFLLEKFPFLTPNNLVFLTDKSVLNCDIRIDDKLGNLDGADIKLLYTAYHNKKISNDELKERGIIRANGWADIEKILLD